MSDNKKYYWLKLKEDFFEEKQIKYLRKLPDGDKLVIAYLKMQLKSLRTEGFIKYDSVLPSNIDELAMILDEDTNIINLMLQALVQVKAIEILDDGSFYMIAMQDLIGKEGQSAERVRKFREKQKILALQCNTDVTKCNTEIEIEIEIEKNNKYIVEIINYLNDTIKSNYKSSTQSTKSKIKARIKEGFTVEDFKSVIDFKASQWLKDSKMCKYLRPETLFGTKFEGYLQESKMEENNGREFRKYSQIDLSKNLYKPTEQYEVDDTGLI